ncbi:hypothetical protein [Rubinisphaera sp. JC750]|uniref:hypothetical protein n=1 Tax=Rubinisphaera sp. JC750 TaxID=2898658 RepID=UPI001F2150BA|nr:hypothetical protein [Rubinisphaera sp. JC750]
MSASVKARPALFRALGNQSPPAEIVIDAETFTLQDVFKHDSWAATAVYEGPRFSVVCKMNRKQPILGIPTRWLGRFLAQRETFAYAKLDKTPGIIPGCGRIYVDGKYWSNATAHVFVPGHPLGSSEQVDDNFFPSLLATLQEVHRRGFAYVDLHKRENILVGEEGEPYLIDFQISYYGARRDLLWPVRQVVLRVLQKSDLYHISKHVKRLRPDQLESLGLEAINNKPWWIKAHRVVAVPFRQTRRWFLTKIGVRGKSGRSATEAFAEHAFRCEQNKAA